MKINVYIIDSFSIVFFRYIHYACVWMNKWPQFANSDSRPRNKASILFTDLFATPGVRKIFSTCVPYKGWKYFCLVYVCMYLYNIMFVVCYVAFVRSRKACDFIVSRIKKRQIDMRKKRVGDWNFSISSAYRKSDVSPFAKIRIRSNQNLRRSFILRSWGCYQWEFRRSLWQLL